MIADFTKDTMNSLTVPPLTDDLREQMHALYRHLHAHPELSMQEHATADLLQRELDELGAETFRCAGTGVVGILRNGEGPTVAFRADTDALPLREETGLDYASSAMGHLEDGTEVPVMHGCGHDTHMAVLVTVTKLLTERRDLWRGTFVAIFQPGEEIAAGARAMVADGLWERAPVPEVVFGQHVMPQAAGTIHYSTGDAMSMADSWRVTVRGKGAHASQPQDSTDPVLLGAHMITRIQGIVSREVDPRQAAVVTVATFQAGLKENIIPSSAEFTLNVRTLNPDVRQRVLSALERIIHGEAVTSGAPEPIIEEISSFPRNYNAPAETAELIETMRTVLGETDVVEVPPLMGSEDFGVLGEAAGVPSVFWMFGGHDDATMDGAAEIPVNHSPKFAPVVEPTLSTGVTAALTGVLSRLGVSPAEVRDED
ncbi:amidohydrolase [Nesterenkonia marinintestina]|uniref:amidohydrolase n=1 Tax=Nesterenkonia marinintestina TaxID=2979865 RepID=UPI0021BFD536|nr:amidohydrolase [Nesterenkonia sp. GX14115]